MPVDYNEVIQEGEFRGLTLQQMLDHASAMQSALTEQTGRTPQPPAAPPAKPPAKDRLRADAGGLADKPTMLTWMRLEQDDEAAFAATVPDYEDYRGEIADLKKNMPPQARVQKGVHARLYEYRKLEKHPELKQALYKHTVQGEAGAAAQP